MYQHIPPFLPFQQLAFNVKKCDIKKQIVCLILTFLDVIHNMKNIRIRSFSGPYFPALGLNTERYGKIRTRKTTNTDIFHAVICLCKNNYCKKGFNSSSLKHSQQGSSHQSKSFFVSFT